MDTELKKAIEEFKTEKFRDPNRLLSSILTNGNFIKLEKVTGIECKVELEVQMKKWYKSKTLWANSALFLIGGFAYLQKGTLTPETMELLTTLGALLNVILRLVTKTKVTK